MLTSLRSTSLNMLQGIGRCRGSQPMHAQAFDVNIRRLGPLGHHLIDAIGTDPGTGGAATDRAKQRARAGLALDIGLQVRMDPFGRDGVQW